MFPLPSAWKYEAELLIEAGIPRLRDTSVLVIGGMCTDAVCSFLPQHGPEGPVSASKCGTSTYHVIGRPERPEYGSRSRTGDECLKHSCHTPHVIPASLLRFSYILYINKCIIALYLMFGSFVHYR